MINFDKIIEGFYEEAILCFEPKVKDSANIDTYTQVINIINHADNDCRVEIIKKWLTGYKVFQGFDTDKRNKITEKCLEWADDDKKIKTNIPLTLDEIVNKHHELSKACNEVEGLKDRKFTSLASKFLWLCYPKYVPLYDSFAKRSLHIITKLDSSLLPDNFDELEEYAKFVYIWYELYNRCRGTHKDKFVDIDNLYAVRIFDKILWLIGRPNYKIKPER